MYDKKFPESEIWIGTSKIAFTPDDWSKKKSPSKDIAGVNIQSVGVHDKSFVAKEFTNEL